MTAIATPYHNLAVPVICAVVLAAVAVGCIHGRPTRPPQPERHVKRVHQE